MIRHDDAVRLCEGGTVLFQGNFIKAMAVPDGERSCEYCRMDCMCHGEITELCIACDDYDGKRHLLYFANEEPPIVADSAR